MPPSKSVATWKIGMSSGNATLDDGGGGEFSLDVKTPTHLTGYFSATPFRQVKEFPANRKSVLKFGKKIGNQSGQKICFPAPPRPAKLRR